MPTSTRVDSDDSVALDQVAAARPLRPGPAVAPTVDCASWEQLTIPSASGASPAALHGAASSNPNGVVVCAHPLRRDAKGFFLRSRRADLLRRNGYDVLLFDFNGVGASSHGGFSYVDDVAAAARCARDRAGTLPVHALAICFGAVWTLCAATRGLLFDAIIVEAPLTTLHEYNAGKPFAPAFSRLLWRLFPKAAAKANPIDASGRIGRNGGPAPPPRSCNALGSSLASPDAPSTICSSLPSLVAYARV